MDIQSQLESIQDIRALLDPEMHENTLKEARKTLVKNLSGLYVELDSIKDNPEIPDEEKAPSVKTFEGLIRDRAWRIRNIDAKLKAAEKAKEEITGAKPTPIREGVTED